MNSSEKESKKDIIRKPSRKIAVTFAVLIAIAATVFASILSASHTVRTSVNAASCSVFRELFNLKAGEGNAVALDTAVNALTAPVLIVLSCAISYALVFYILRVCKAQKRTAMVLAFAPVLAPVILSFFGGFGMASWLIMAAAVLCVVALLLFDFLKEKYPKIFKSMAVAYIFFGALTTAVSIITKMIFESYGWWVFFSVTASWVITVLFAYVVNKLFVFKTDTDTKEELLKEAGTFFAMRLISWAFEWLFLECTTVWLAWPWGPCVLLSQVVILISNYFFSKMKVFVKRKEDKKTDDTVKEEPKRLKESNDKKD